MRRARYHHVLRRRDDDRFDVDGFWTRRRLDAVFDRDAHHLRHLHFFGFVTAARMHERPDDFVQGNSERKREREPAPVVVFGPEKLREPPTGGG